jgi:hypothetical protein
MCGGTIEFETGATVGECEYCGTKQTLPRLDNDKKANLYDRANHFRRNNDFDKAMSIYEQILNEDNTDAEAYWSLVLCRYGIEYVEDPATKKRIPTVNRAQYTSIFADEDYKSAIQCADSYQKVIYEEEAKAIDEIQKGILSISQKEEPFDVFICYKETDNNGRRTQDSVLANDLYHQLTQEGFKVFFSRITLEDKLGTAYEPYIFAALNSAKVMVVLGTKQEYFNAVWVKNEWSRYLALIKNDANKILIPAYRDMDPYDLPEEFSHLQAQDMSKLGFMQDLIRGVNKILGKGSKIERQSSLTRRAQLFLEEHNWDKVLEYCEQILDANPESGETYWIKELAERRCENADDLINFYCLHSERESKTLSYARRFANQATNSLLESFDNGLKEAEAIKKKRIEKENLARKSSPFAQKIKRKIEQARNQMRLLEDRVFFLPDVAAAVTSDGKVVVTEEKDVTFTDRESDDGRYILSGRIGDVVQNWTGIYKIYDTGYHGIIGLKYDGTLLFADADSEGGKFSAPVLMSEMSKWKGVDKVYKTAPAWFGVTRTGTVLYANAVYPDLDDEDYHNIVDDYDIDVSELKDVQRIVLLDSDGVDFIFIKNDGTLCTAVNSHKYDEISKWTDIVDIYKVLGRIVGVKGNGTLIATECPDYLRDGYDKWSEMSSWTDVVKIYNLECRVVALDAYGQLLATTPFQPDEKQKEEKYDEWEKISSWEGLVDLYIGEYHAIGLRYDGSVLVEKWFDKRDGEFYDRGQTNVENWVNVVKLFCSRNRTVCVKRDGSVDSVGVGDEFLTDFITKVNNVDSFKLFDDIETLEEEIKVAAYDAYVAEVNSQIEAEITIAVEPIKEKYDTSRQPILSEMNQSLHENRQKKKELEERRSNLVSRRAGLGLLKKKEKATIDSQISDIESQMVQLESEQMIRDRYKSKLTGIRNQEEADIREISEEIKSKYIVSIDEFQFP